MIINNFFINKFEKNNFGRILHFGSTATNLKKGSAPYSSTKAAIYDYVKKMGNNYSNKNIYFNCIKTSIVFIGALVAITFGNSPSLVPLKFFNSASNLVLCAVPSRKYCFE